MSDERTAVIEELYRAFNARDIDAVLAHLAPGVDWPNGWEGGREIGRDAVRAYWQRQWAAIDPRVEPMAIETDQEGRTHVRVHQLVKSLDGKILDDSKVEHVYDFEGPFIRRMTIVKGQPNDEDDED
jgi:hypothetical protein